MSASGGFWLEVPCGHPKDPVAAVMPDGQLACHCGGLLELRDAMGKVGPLSIVPCRKCGCYLGCADDAVRGEK